MPSPCAGTAVRAPEEEVEVVALSPLELLGCDGCYVCETCGRGFRRHQNLRLHRRRHAAPPDELAARKRKRVFVCPEPGCRRHAPSDALANLTSLKKHFRRKHGAHGMWACGRGSGSGAVAAAVRADDKARGACDGCGCVFPQLESYVEHQGTCAGSRLRPEKALEPPPALGGGVVLGFAAATSTRTTTQQQDQLNAVVANPSSDDDIVVSSEIASAAAAAAAVSVAALGTSLSPPTPPARPGSHNVELQLMPPGESCAAATCSGPPPPHPPAAFPRLDVDLSLGLGGAGYDAATARLMVEEAREQQLLAKAEKAAAAEARAQAMLMVDEARQQLLLAMTEKAAAEVARAQARRRAELAGLELASAQSMRQQAQVELGRAHAARQLVDATLLQVTNRAAAGSSTPGLPH